MISERNTVVKVTTRITGEGSIALNAGERILSLEYAILDGGKKLLGGELEINSDSIEISFKIASPELWSTRSPKLYTLKLTVVYESGKEEITEKFGIREISKDENSVLLNGKPFYVRGYIRGIKAHDHPDNANLGEREYYRKNIIQAKRYGFNFIRFHSTIPPKALFDAADELGMLIHIEIRRELDEYNNLEEMISDTQRLISPEFAAETVNRLYNHPSLAVYCIGNEIKGTKVSDEVQKIRTNIIANDPTRLFLDTCAWGANGRDWVDIDVQHMSYYFPFGKHEDMFEDTENLLVVGDADGNKLLEAGENSIISRELRFDVPLLAHEVCHYTALRDFAALKAKFEKYGTKAPWWIDEELKMIKAKGFEEIFPEMYRASKLFQHECWKRAFEAIRGSHLLAGFHFLQFTDTDIYENSNGMVDCFDDESFISPDEVLDFNGDRVLLAKFENRLVSAGDELHIPISISNYAETGETHGKISYTLTGEDGSTLAYGNMKNLSISRGGLYKLCAIRVKLSETLPSQKLTLSVKLTSDIGIVTSNSWSIWSFEKAPAETYDSFIHTERDDIVITADIEGALSALEEGKRVCLVYRSDYTRHLLHQDMEAPKYALPATWNRYKPVIWDRGTNYGGICNYELLNKYGFPTGKYYSENYSVVTEDCDKINLDNFPCKVDSIITGVDKSVRDRFDAYAKYFNLPELQYDRTMRNFSYLFELCVGEGKLLVSGLNLTGLDKNEPSTVRMASFIRSYLTSDDFAPKSSVSHAEFVSFLEESARVIPKERIMTQFWQLDDTPVESPEFWHDSKVYLGGKW